MTEEFMTFAEALADRAGAVIRTHYRQALQIETKADASPVTQADRGAEQAMRAMIGERYPAHGILGEEFGETNPGAEFRWVLDPVDGTKSFVMGIPLFCTLIALEHAGRPVLGVIDQPILGYRTIGDGQVTRLNGTPVRVRPCRRVEDALLLTPDHHDAVKHRRGAAFEALSRAVRCYRCIGDGYAYALLVSGFVDLAVDPVMNVWDLHPLIPVVRGAGGMITSWDGGDPVGATDVIAAHPDLHREVLARLNR